MLLELVILLSIANIVFTILIMKQCSGAALRTRKKAKIEEEEEEYEEEPEKTVETQGFSSVQKSKPSAKTEYTPLKTGRFAKFAEKFSSKKDKTKKHVSEMPDMNRVIEELQEEFKNQSKKEETKHKKSKNEIADRLKEIEEA